MKKTGLKVSGIFTIIVYVVVLLCSLVFTLANFESTSSMLENILPSNILSYIVAIHLNVFVLPLLGIASKFSSVEFIANLVNNSYFYFACGILMVVIAFVLFILAIVNLKKTSLDDTTFVQKKKSVNFSIFLNWLLFIWVLLSTLLFVAEVYLYDTIQNVEFVKGFISGIPTMSVLIFEGKIVPTVVLAVYLVVTLVIAISALSTKNKVVKAVKMGGGLNQQPYSQQYYNQNGYGPQAPYGQQPYAQSQYPMTPNYNPETLTERTKIDLARLERLKNSGAISPENYERMRDKVLSSSIKPQ